MRKALAVVSIVAGFIGIATGSASSAPRPVAGCSESFELMTVKQVLRTLAAPGFDEAIIAEDSNADGFLCIKVVPNEGGPPQFDPAFVFVDNTVGD
jgi:hypothetical protein